MLRKLWDDFLKRTPAQRHARLSRLLMRARRAEENAAAEVRRLQSKYGATRRTRRALNRLDRLTKKTAFLILLVAHARPRH